MLVEQARELLLRQNFVGFEFDPNDAHLSGWIGAGYRAGWVFSRRSMSWAKDCVNNHDGLLELYTRSLGEPKGPWAQRVWNTVIVLPKSEHWILLRQPALLTLGSLTLDLTRHDR